MQLKTLLKKSVRSCRKICIFVQDVEKSVHPSRAKKQLATLFFLGSSQKRQQFHFCEAPLNLRSNTDCIKRQHCSGTLAQQIGIGIIRREHLMSSTYILNIFRPQQGRWSMLAGGFPHRTSNSQSAFRTTTLGSQKPPFGEADNPLVTPSGEWILHRTLADARASEKYTRRLMNY